MSFKTYFLTFRNKGKCHTQFCKPKQSCVGSSWGIAHVPFRKRSRGSCLQTWRSVGSWSEKSGGGKTNICQQIKNFCRCFSSFPLFEAISHLAFTEGFYLLRTRRLAVLQSDAGAHLLPHPLVFHTNHLQNKHVLWMNKMNKSVATKHLSLKPHRIELTIEMTLRTLKRIIITLVQESFSRSRKLKCFTRRL